MKKVLLATTTLFSALFLVNSVHAMPPLPAKCPDVSDIQSVGVSTNVLQGNNLVWYAGRRNQAYSTADHWTFVMGNIVATDSSDAYAKATTGLATLAFQLGPFAGPYDKWVCYYNTVEGYAAVAITTPLATLKAGMDFIKK